MESGEGCGSLEKFCGFGTVILRSSPAKNPQAQEYNQILQLMDRYQERAYQLHYGNFHVRESATVSYAFSNLFYIAL